MRLMICYASCLFLFLLPVKSLLAHGAPIVLVPNGTSLSVSGGLPDSQGFASRIFVEDDEDGDGEASPGPVPGVGNAFLWEIPGINMSGLNTQSSLSLEVLASTVKDNPSERRTLWYWHLTNGVVPASSDFYLLGTDVRIQRITPEDRQSLPPFLLADPVGGTAAEGGEQGFHNHGLLTYALDFDSPPAFGAYGVFAQFTSDLYESSNPFLIVLNYGVDYELMTEAALAINAAADIGATGDFNFDDVVDAADYAIWRKTLGGTEEYEVWRKNFGTALNGAGSSAEFPVNTAVPESKPLLSATAAIGIIAMRRGRRMFCPAVQGGFALSGSGRSDQQYLLRRVPRNTS